MHRKLVFSVAAVFLVMALVVPPTLVILQTNNTIYKYIIPGIYPTEGSTNVTITVRHSNKPASIQHSRLH